MKIEGLTTLGRNLSFAHFEIIPDDEDHFVVAVVVGEGLKIGVFVLE